MGEQIDLAMESGIHFRANVVRRRNGLVLHKTVPAILLVDHAAPNCRACWTVTHAASGLAIAQHVRTRYRAERVLAALARLGDWTWNQAALSADKTLGARVRKVLKRPGGGA